MNTSDSLDVDIFKTTRRPDTFLFLPKDLAESEWPEGLSSLFVSPEKVMTLTLTPEQPLAAQPAALVMAEIRSRGYFLQLPPQSEPAAATTETALC